MDMLSISRQVLSIVKSAPAVYVRLIPEVLDFTIEEPGTIEISTATESLSIPFDPKCAQAVFSLLEHAIENRVVLAWSFKNIATLSFHYTKAPIEWSAQVRDIKVIEAFQGIPGKQPATFGDAMRRMAALAELKEWRRLYKEVHLPLISEVVPHMESTGLISDTRRRLVHPYYEVEGQRQGRMKAINAFGDNSYNPHTMGADSDVRPLLGQQYLLFDYRNMEVTMLAWLSKDRRLQAILDSGRDVYETIWHLLVDQRPSAATRKLCKDIFLPVAYGMGEGALVEKLGNLEAARILMNAIHDRFSTAMGWLRQAQDSKAPNGLVRDHFERPRIFEAGSHKIRNFVIQAPAAIVCEERLVALHRAIQGSASLAFHVHDGYAITCPKSSVGHVFGLAKEALESQSPLCPGLKLQTAGKIGERLDALNQS